MPMALDAYESTEPAGLCGAQPTFPGQEHRQLYREESETWILLAARFVLLISGPVRAEHNGNLRRPL